MCDPHHRLLRTLQERAGQDATLVEASAEPWASITFTGMRHHLSFVTDAEGADRLASMGEEHVAIPGHLLAELVVRPPRPAGSRHLVEIAALTLENG